MSTTVNKLTTIRSAIDGLISEVNEGASLDGNFHEGFARGYEKAYGEARAALAEHVARLDPSVILRGIAGHLEATMPRVDPATEGERVARLRLVAICRELAIAGGDTFGHLRYAVDVTSLELS